MPLMPAPSRSNDGAGVGIDLVQVKIRRTLAVGGKLFVRLNVANTLYGCASNCSGAL